MSNNFKFGKNSLAKLSGVDVRLVDCCTLALSRSPFDLTIVEGLRSKERQAELYAQGRTLPGPIVTWTKHSKHLTGKAVDIAPLNMKGQIPWNDKTLFMELGALMMKAAADLKINIRHGADWDKDGILYEKGEYDGPHFELVD